MGLVLWGQGTGGRTVTRAVEVSNSWGGGEGGVKREKGYLCLLAEDLKTVPEIT